MKIFGAVLTLALGLLASSNLLAADPSQPDSPPPKRAPRLGGPTGGLDFLRGLDLSAEQKAKLADVMKEYGPKFKETSEKMRDIYTDEQKAAIKEAVAKARADGKNFIETRKAVEDAVKPTPEQQAKLDSIRKDMEGVQKEIRGKVMDILTPEQKELVEKKIKETSGGWREEVGLEQIGSRPTNLKSRALGSTLAPARRGCFFFRKTLNYVEPLGKLVRTLTGCARGQSSRRPLVASKAYSCPSSGRPVARSPLRTIRLLGIRYHQDNRQRRRGVSEAPKLDDQVVAALRRIARSIDLHSRDLLQQCGLTAPQLLTMRALVRLEPVAVTGLAAAVSVSQATMTGILDRLEQQGFVVRNRDQGDRRNMLVSSTPLAVRFLESAPSILQDRFSAELARLEPAEQRAMLATLQRIAQMMGAGELHAAPILTSGPESLIEPNHNPHA